MVIAEQWLHGTGGAGFGACCWAFPSIVASGRNSTTLHYETNDDPIVRDGLLLTDLGAERSPRIRKSVEYPFQSTP